MMKAKSSKRYNNIDFRGGMSRRTCLSFRNDLHLDRIKSFTLVHGSTYIYRGVFEGFFLQNILKEAKSNYQMKLCHNSFQHWPREQFVHSVVHTRTTPRDPQISISHFTPFMGASLIRNQHFSRF